MDENREISSTPLASCEGRSVKANSRTTDMHVQEKSDCAVIPVNRPNKGRQLPAEAGEGRAQMKENIDQSRMLLTQSGEGMSQRLDGVRRAAKGKRQEQFTALLHHFNIDLLRSQASGFAGGRWCEVAGGRHRTTGATYYHLMSSATGSG